MQDYVDQMLLEAKKAMKRKEVPVGAVVVCNNKIIARAYNKRVKTNNVMAHAEILAIKKAAKKKKDWRLNDCDLYVTLEPCNMCMEVIKESRINNVFYLVKRSENKKNYYKTNVRIIENENYSNVIKSYQQELSHFFKLNCKR